jgi:signal transduction histidine kinase
MKYMTRLNGNIKFAIGLIFFCGVYWILDSAWSFLSFERNLSVLIFQEPMSYVDTLMLRVPPYQAVSRIMVTGIFIVSGTLIAIFIHKRKRVEKEKIRLERQLLQAQKMESIGTLAGGIAHDFNNILYGMIGYTEMCLDDAEPDTLLHSNLKEVLSGLQRAKTLVDQILTFSRQTKSEIAPTPVQPIMLEVIRLLKSTIPSTINIQLNELAANSTIKADPTQMYQVIMNLCTNAVHAMEAHGGVLNITLANEAAGSPKKKQSAVDLPPGRYLKLSIADNGSGIPKKILNRVFDPFFTSKAPGKGTGLGLSIVHGIVKSHNGHIQVKSKEGCGTTFDIYFPLLEEIVQPQNRDGSDLLQGDHAHVSHWEDQGVRVT